MKIIILLSVFLIGTHAVTYKETATDSEKSDEWKMLFTCRNKTTNEIVVMPKKSRAMVDQIIFRKMFGVDDCKTMKLKKEDSWRLFKLPFTIKIDEESEVTSDTAFVDLPQDGFPVFDLKMVFSPFKYLDKMESTTTENIELNTIPVE
ncbi:hypothetical protein ACFFRR_007625 [Megaselia abdita]